MKKASYQKKIFLFFIFILMISNMAWSQDKISFATGFGIPEWLYIGVRKPVKQFQFELTAGASPAKGDKLYSLTGNVFYHFAGKADLSERKPWYAKTGLVYMYDDNSEYSTMEYLYWNIRFGREFNLTKNIGMSFDGGLILEINKWKTIKKTAPSSGFNINLDFPVLPSAGFHIYYRI